MAQEAAQVVVSCPVIKNANTGAGTTGTTVAGGGPGVSGVAPQPEPQVKPKPRSPAHYLWAALIARIYEVFPLICPQRPHAHHRLHHIQRRHPQDP